MSFDEAFEMVLKMSPKDLEMEPIDLELEKAMEMLEEMAFKAEEKRSVDDNAGL